MKNFTNLKRFLYNRIIFFNLSKKKFNTADSLVIFSEARGGSTWLLQLLASIPNVIINWEPLHKIKGTVPTKFNWGWRPHVTPQNNEAECLEYLNKTFSFSNYNEWTTKLVNLKKIDESKLVLTKFVRANRLISFILDNFQFKHKPILLVRHPIDVCNSQIRAFHTSENSITKAKVFEAIESYELSDSQKAVLQNLNTALEYKIFIWCYNNCRILEEHRNDSRLILLHYELLILNPPKYLDMILEEWGIQNKLAILKNLNYSVASRTDYNSEYNANPEAQLFKNFKSLSKIKSEKIQAIFDSFNFRIYNAKSPFPDLKI